MNKPIFPAPDRHQSKGVTVEDLRRNLSRGLSFRALERRIAFDAAAVATAEQVVDQQAEPHAGDADGDAGGGLPVELLGASEVASATSGGSIVFISSAVSDIGPLLSGLDANAEVVILAPDRDGVVQIAEALEGRTGLDAIHIISHGGPGYLSLGNTVLDADSMQAEHLDELTAIGTALSADGDILVYGCDFTSGDSGLEAAIVLGGITGADIAASNDDTGAVQLGGDWVLETEIGSVDTATLAAESWQSLLAPITTTPLNGTSTTATTLANAIAGTGITVLSATFTGDNSQAGTFSSGSGYTPEWLAYDSGILLSTGNLAQVLGPNTAGGSSVDAPGATSGADALLTGVGGGTSFDAAVLEFTFIPTSNLVTLQLTFGSEEYNEYVYSTFNDAMGIWINGVQAAVTPSGAPFSVDTINQAATYNPANGNQNNDPNPSNGVYDSNAPSLYVNNAPNAGTFNTGMDGFTVTLSLIGNVNVGVANTIRIGIADIGDAAYDSFLFVRADSFQGQTIAQTDSVTTGRDVPVVIDALDNDLDTNGDPLLITHIADHSITAGGPSVTLASGATVALGLDGQLTYTPAPGVTGSDLFTYTISDGTGGTAVGFIDVAIIPNSPPIVDLNANDTSPTATFADTIATGNYANSTGTGAWSSAWTEVNDDGNSAAGDVRIVTDGTPVLELDNTSNGIRRSANLSAYTQATLTFDYRRNGFDNFNDYVVIQASSDGVTFVEIGRFMGPATDAAYQTFTADISSFISANTTIRFMTSSALANGEWIRIDNVNITAIAPVTSYSTSYTENAAPVSIAATTGAGAGITDYDSTAISSAVVTILNPVAGDFLSLIAALPAGITASIAPSGTSVELTGNASLASYEAAIERIGFASTSDNPSATPRQVQVVVWDDTGLQSDAATTTITVSPVNDAPVSTTLGDLVNSDADVVSVDVSGNFSDPDATDVLTFSATGLPAGLSIDPSTGVISGTIDNSASVSGPYSVTITATDPSGATTQQTFTWTVDNPAPDAQDDDLAGSENATLTGSVLADNGNGTDSDADGDTLVVSAVNGVAGNVGNAIAGSNGGTFTVDASGAYTFVPGSDFDDLAVGETRTTTITYTIQDNEGGSDTATVTVTITGTNDAPVSTALGDLANNDADVVSIDVSGSFSDPDASDVLTFSATGLPAGLAIDPSTGIISGTIQHSASVTGPYSVTITATDPSGATTQQTFTWSVDNPAPDAQDDDLAGSENATLTGSVLANNGNGTDSDADGDTLVVSAVNGVAGNVGNAIAGSNGGTFTVQASGAYTFVPGSDFDDLAVGETRTTTITYTIQDNEGGSDTATVTVTITGTNDAPVSTALGDLANNDADVVSVDVSGNFSDPDASDVLTFSATGLPAGLAIDPSTGIISGTIQHSASVTGPYSVTVTATDPSGATTQQTFTWSITNPAPDAIDDVLGVTENASGNGDVIANDSDVDGDTLVVSAVNGVAGNVGNAIAGSNGGTFTVQASGAYTFVPGADFDDLAVGETRTTTVTYTIQDNEGGSDTATVTVTITGTNDAPVSTALGDLANSDADVVSVDVSSNFSDPDASDVLTFGATGLPAGLAIDPSTGIISGTIQHSASVTGPYSVTITATDPSGATTQQTFTWSVDNPAPDAQDDDLAGSENATLTGSVLANNGNGIDSDVDGDTLVVSAVNGVAGNVGNAVAGSNGGTFTVDASGAYTFVPGGDFDDLAVGETRTTTVTYTITDNEGGSDTATVTVTITGTNDAPVSTALGDLSNSDADVVSVDVSGNFSDPDATDVLTFSATGLPAGLAIDPSTGVISGTIQHSASVTGPYSVTVTATDPSGATTQQTFTWSVDNPAPDAQDDDLAGSENATLTGSVLANNGNGTDSDVDGDTLVVSAVNGVAGNVGSAVAGSNGGTFTVQPSGAYTFVPGGDFDDLAVGETRTTTITYTIQDNEGGSDTATVTVTITGTNDAPVSTPLSNLSNDDADVVSVDVSGNFSDPDTTDVLTFSATGLPAGLAIDPSTGVISGTIDNSASVTGPYSVTVTATDPSGATTQQTFTWSVDNPAPDAQDDDLAGSENATLTGSVLANNGNGIDSDVDGDTLVVSAVNGVAGNVGNAVAGSNGGTFTVDASGAYTFVPGGDFDDLAVGETRTTTVTYTITDNEGGSDTATVTVTITGTNDAPVSTALGDLANNDADVVSVDVSGNFSDPDATDVLTFSATGLPAGLAIDPSTGVISGTIDNSASVTGPYSVTITATDPSGATTQQTFTWSVDNPAPDAQDDDLAGSENATLTGSVLADNGNGTDSDVDGDTLVVSAVNGVAGNVGSAVAGSNGGTFTVQSSGAYTFVPGADFDDLAVGETRTTTITYTIQDNEGGSDTATVTVTITGTNDAPVASSPPLSTAEDTPVDGTITSSDVDDDTLTYTLANPPANGSVTLNPDGTFTYTPDPDYNGGDTFTVTVSDGNGGSVDVTIPVTVTPVNDAPVASSPPLATAEDTPVDGTITSSDIDGDTLAYTLANPPANGTVTLNPDGTFTYTPDPDYNGGDTFTVTVGDGNGGSVDVTIPVTVTPVNDAPVASDDTATSSEDRPVTIAVLANDSDPDGDPLQVIAASTGDGSVVVNPDGTITFTPAAGFDGIATVTYVIGDGQGGTATATVRIDCSPAADHVALPDWVRDTPDPARPDAMTPITVHGVVVDTVNGIEGLGGIAGSLDVDGVVIAAANGIDPLGGLARFDGKQGAVQKVLDQEEMRRLHDEYRRQAGDGLLKPWDVKGLSGFSLRFHLGSAQADASGDELVFSSLVRDRVLVLQISTAFESERRLVEYRVMQADGRPLPAWMDRVGRELLVGQHPPSIETLDLRVTAIYDDGRAVTRTITIQTDTGEIQSLEQRRGDVAPPMFSDDLRQRSQAGDQDIERLYRALGSR